MTGTQALLADECEAYAMDVHERDAWAASLGGFTARNGRLDVLAGVGGAITDAPFDQIGRTIAVNLRRAFNGARTGHAYRARMASSCLLHTASTLAT